MTIPVKLIAYGVGALILSGALGYGVYRIRLHFNEYARLEQAEKTLTTERDLAIDANEAWAAENDRRLALAQQDAARERARADREERNHRTTRGQLQELQNAPGRDEAMPPVLESAFDIVRQRRSGDRGEAGPAPTNLGRGGATTVPPPP